MDRLDNDNKIRKLAIYVYISFKKIYFDNYIVYVINKSIKPFRISKKLGTNREQPSNTIHCTKPLIITRTSYNK